MILSVQTDGAGTITVFFSVAVAAASVDPTEMTIDVDAGVGPAVQVDPSTVSFTCGSFSIGLDWHTTSAFAPGIPAADGFLV